MVHALSAQGPHTFARDSAEKQLVTFQVGTEEYAFHISKIREIIRFSRITKLPNTSSFNVGVINLRGKVISIYDLRALLSQVAAEYTKKSRIIIVNYCTTTIGLLVDKVSHVVKVPPSSLQPPPAVGSDQQSVEALCRVGSHLIILLDMDKVINARISCRVSQQERSAGDE